MAFKLPELPYDLDALEPHISKETLYYHYSKHHQAYVNKLNTLTNNTPMADQSLETLIKETNGGVFNNAAQVWNHTFYWHCMKPNGGGNPSGPLAKAIERAFNSFDEFTEKFTQVALKQFGSGWAWLVKAPKTGHLTILSTSNAENPMTDNHIPLLTCDVWEHAYYVDTRNDRGKYIDNFWNVVNWSFVEDKFANE